MKRGEVVFSWNDTMEFKVKGVSFYRDAVGALQAGETIWAVPENDNVHDANAVVVRSDRGTIGHVSRGSAPSVRRVLQRAGRFDGCEGTVRALLEWNGPTGVIVKVGGDSTGSRAPPVRGAGAGAGAAAVPVASAARAATSAPVAAPASVAPAAAAAPAYTGAQLPALTKMKKQALMEECQQRGVANDGTVPELKARLREARGRDSNVGP